MKCYFYDYESQITCREGNQEEDGEKRALLLGILRLVTNGENMKGPRKKAGAKKGPAKKLQISKKKKTGQCFDDTKTRFLSFLEHSDTVVFIKKGSVPLTVSYFNFTCNVTSIQSPF